jgi:hypothetical protein
MQSSSGLYLNNQNHPDRIMVTQLKNDRIKISFIGGCIHYPIRIKTGETYHSLLQNTLPHLEIYKSSYTTFASLVSCARHSIETESPDVLFVFLRHSPYFALNKPIVRLARGGGGVYFRIHPYLLNRSLRRWPPGLDVHAAFKVTADVPTRAFFGLRDMNSILGKFMGLHSWASRYVLDLLKEVEQLTRAHGVQLVVIGPMRNPQTYMGDHTCRYFNAQIKKAMAALHVRFIDICDCEDADGNPLFQRDKVHFNANGQRYVFEKILAEMESLVPAQLSET